MSKNLLINTNDMSIFEPRRYYQEYEGTFITVTDKSEDDTLDTSRYIEVTEIWGNTVQDENNLEDIQSVGELYVDDEGNPILDDLGREQYKVEIESCNKNLFSNNIEDWEIGSINGTTGENADANNRIRTKHFIKIPKGSTIFWEKNNLSDKFEVRIYDKSKKCLFGGGFLGGNNTKLPHYDEAYYLKFIVAFSDESKIIPQDVKNFIIKVEINSTGTEYIPHQSNKTTILLPCQLQKVGTVYDRLYWDSEKGKYVVEKKIKTMILDNSDDEKWAGYGSACHWSDPQFTKHNVISSNSAKPAWTNGIYIHPAGIIYLFPGFESLSTEEFKQWLSENPVTIVFEPTTPQLIETNITEKIQLPCYSEKTHVFVNSTVDATMKVLVPYKEII